MACPRDGKAIGVRAGRQSRVDCTGPAGAKAVNWWLRRHPALRELTTGARLQDVITAQVDGTAVISGTDRADSPRQLDQVAFVSDGAPPFSDNVEQAPRHGVRYIPAR